MKEYRLTIQAFGQNEEEAIECAVRMLNLGADFDEVTYFYDEPERPESPPTHDRKSI